MEKSSGYALSALVGDGFAVGFGLLLNLVFNTSDDPVTLAAIGSALGILVGVCLGLALICAIIAFVMDQKVLQSIALIISVALLIYGIILIT